MNADVRLNPTTDALIDVSNISKSFRARGYSIQALNEVSFTVGSAQVFGLVGPDAAGKTTLMRLIAGLLKPDSGYITVFGKDATRESSSVQANVGYMPQRFGLYQNLSVQENLNLYADLQGVPVATRTARCRELMAMTGLAAFTRRLAGRLSGGMKQKLGLACTLIRPPRLLLLDEPTVGVDPVSRRELWTIIYELVRDQQMSVLLTTTYFDEAERCNQVILMDEGQVLGQGPPDKFAKLADVLRGQVSSVRAPRISKRLLQQRLIRIPGVMDAVIRGDAIRVIMRESATTAISDLLVSSKLASIEPVAPNFEDGFIARVHAGQSAKSSIDIGNQPHADVTQSQLPVIEVHNLTRHFGAFYAVKNLSFSIRTGEVFGLLGANGAGKTTTFRMLCGLLPSSEGQLRVAGVDLRHAAARARAHIGYMPQKFSLYEELTVRQNLEFFASAYGLTGKRRRLRVNWALDKFELSHYTKQNGGSLPLGFKQRLSLAAALMHEPRILFLDEPTSGVDPLARRGFWQTISALSEQGVTILVTTHFMEEAEYCDRLAIMADGELIKLGTPEEIRAAAITPGNPQPSMEDAFISLSEANASRKWES